VVNILSHNNLPIGVFDSGLGGVSVLAEAARILPQESFIYLGDSAHNPYGTKEVAEVKQLSLQAADFLLEKGIKALVVACNTATSAAINDLREYLDLPVIGMEPALKPAVENTNQGNILVMATPVTLREKKFRDLLRQYGEKKEILLLPCPGLAELIETGIYSGPPIQDYLTRSFSSLDLKNISTVVLGCTHYIFIKKELERLIPHGQIIDGNRGTVKNLQRILGERGLLADPSRKERSISYYSTADPARFLPLCQELFNYYLACHPEKP